MFDQNFVYTCAGTEGSDFMVTLPAARPDDLYNVTCTLAGLTSLFTFQLPNAVASDRTTTQFRVRTSAAVQAGDRLELHVFDATQLRRITVAASDFALEAGGSASLIDGKWTFSAASVLTAQVPVVAGAKLRTLTMYCDRGGAGTLTMTTCKALNATKTILNTTALAAGTGWTQATTPALGYVVEDGYELYVRIEATSATNLVGYVVVEYESGADATAWRGFQPVNVQSFGAIGDGTADDRPAIEAAITAADALGAEVYFPPGVYSVSRSPGLFTSLLLQSKKGLTLRGEKGRSWLKHPNNVANSPGIGSCSIMRISDCENITIKGLGFDGNWGNAVTRIAKTSDFAVLPQSTIHVDSTAEFPDSGTFHVVLSSGVIPITYSSKTATTFIGCTGGTGTLLVDTVVGYVKFSHVSVEVAAGSNGAVLPQSTINVSSTAGLPASGQVQIRTVASGAQTVTYASKTATTLAGCAGGTGTLTTGDEIWWAEGINQELPVQVDPKSHALFVYGSDGTNKTPNNNVVIEDCLFKQTYGDFVWIGAWSYNVTLRNCVGNISARNGVTLSNNAEGVRIERCKFSNIITQAIDTEPEQGPVRDVVIDDCDLDLWWDPTRSLNGVSLSVAGGTLAGPGEWASARNFRVHDCRIKGSVVISTAKDVHISRNRIMCDLDGETLAPVLLIGKSDDVFITDNYIYFRTGNTNTSNKGAINLSLYGLGIDSASQAQGVFVRNNTIHARNGAAGIHVWGTGGRSGTTGTATSITGLTMVHTGAGWLANAYQTYTVVRGTAIATVLSNTADTLTLAPVAGSATRGWHDARGNPVPTPAVGAYVIVSEGQIVDVSGNYIDCVADDGRLAGGKGIILDGDVEDPGGMRVRCERNTIRGATGDGIYVEASAAFPIRSLRLVANTIFDDQPVATCANGIAFTGLYLTKLVMADNMTEGVATPVAGLTSGRWLLADGQPQQWAGYGAPNNSLAAGLGSTYQRIDGNASQRFYRKEGTTTANRGWRAYRPANPLDWAFDETSTVARPKNAAEWTAFLADVGVTSGGPSHLHLFQEASGIIDDKIGTLDLTALGTPTYGNAIPQQAALGVGFTGPGNQGFFAAGGYNPATQSVLRILLVDFGAFISGERVFATMTWTGGNAVFCTVGAGSGQLRVYPGGGISTQAYPGLGLVPVAIRYDRTAGTHTLLTHLEVLASTYVGGVVDGNKGVGDSQNFGSPANTKISYDVTFVGSAAEKTNADIRAIFEGLGYYVGW